MKILVVEDDDTLRKYIAKALSETGYSTSLAKGGKEAIEITATEKIQLVLLDLKLSGDEDGNWVIRKLRECGHNCGIIMITGQGGEEDKIRSYDAGADDYLVKPFQISELVAKIHVWRKRMKDFLATPVEETMLAGNGFYLNILKPYAVFTDDGKEITITPNEFKILELLFRRKGKIVTQSSLAEYLWKAQYDHNENAIESAIKRLRAKIDVEEKPSLIKTIRGSGYTIEEI